MGKCQKITVNSLTQAQICKSTLEKNSIQGLKNTAKLRLKQ